MFKINSPKSSVSEILQDFEQKIHQLRDLANRKNQEAAETSIKIADLQVIKADAEAESNKASKAADKIAQFLSE